MRRARRRLDGGISATIIDVKIVVDTNIFVGACIGMGACNRVVAACLQGACTPLMGTTLFNEYEDVLRRTSLFKRSRLNASEREVLLDVFLAHCSWVRIYCGWRPNLPDEGDNHLIELAVAGGAASVVTRNTRDFRQSELQFPSVTIRSPEALLEELMP